MESLFKFFENLFKDFTWSRFTFLLVLTIFLAGTLFIFETYTGTFKLKRISAEIKIIESLVELEKKVATLPNDSPSKRYFDRVIENSEQNKVSILNQFAMPNKALKKILYQVAPWIILMFLMFITTKERGNMFVGVLLLSSPLIVIGYNLPNSTHLWINNWVYPWGSLIVIIIGITIWQKRKT